MSKFFIKKAFTIAELFFSLLTIVFIAYVAINLVFRDNKNEHADEANQNNYLICYEAKTENEHGSKYDSSIQGCKFELTPEIEAKEFFEIKLIGGGGGASDYQNGGSGEERVAVYPSLALPFGSKTQSKHTCSSPKCATCNNDGACTVCVPGYRLDNGNCVVNFYYRAVLGEGGKVGENGGQTSLLVVEKSSGQILKILETAAGGQTSNSSESTSSSVINTTSSDFGSGNGGLSPNGHGQAGEVRIQW